MRKQFAIALLAMLCSAIMAVGQNTPPADATIETWQASYSMTSAYGTEADTEPMQVAFVGSDVYLNLLNPLTGATWVKGTVEADKATFAKGQTIGSYGGVTYCMAGSADGQVVDVVFDYDAAAGVLSLSNMYLLLNNGTTDVNYAAYFSQLTISRQAQQTDPDPQQQGQTPPDEAVKEQWTISYTFTAGGETESDTEQMQVAFVGKSVYFNFPNPIKGNTWMRGTLSGSVATFARGQEVGSYGDDTIYYMGLGESNTLGDIVFYYDEANATFTLGNNWLVLNAGLTENRALGYFTAATIVKTDRPDVPKPETVTPPEDLSTSEYALTGTNIFFGDEGWDTKSVHYNVRLGFSGASVYVQGLCRTMPQAWIKGQRNASDGELTFASGQYYGSYQTPLGMSYDFFFAAANYPTTNATWLDEATFSYDAQNQSYACRDLIVLNSQASQINPYEFLAGVRLSKISNRAATPQAPTIVALQPYDAEVGYGLLQLDIPVQGTGGEDLLTDKLGYQLYVEQGGQQQLYTFTPAVYQNLAEPMTLVPYNFGDGFDFYLAGSAVYFYDDMQQAERIGVQCVYTGGDERHESTVTWIAVPQSSAAIDGVASTATGSVSYTDLMGRQVSASHKGLVLKTVRKADGTVVTTKVVR